MSKCEKTLLLHSLTLEVSVLFCLLFASSKFYNMYQKQTNEMVILVNNNSLLNLFFYIFLYFLINFLHLYTTGTATTSHGLKVYLYLVREDMLLYLSLKLNNWYNGKKFDYSDLII